MLKAFNYFTTLTILTAIIIGASFASADTIDELKKQAATRSITIEQLEKEIKAYQTEISKTQTQAKSLTNEIKNLDLTTKKISTDISLTQNKIVNTSSKINELVESITDKAERIRQSQASIAEALRALKNSESDNLFEMFTSGFNLSQIAEHQNSLAMVQDGLQNKIAELRGLKTSLEVTKSSTETEKSKLTNLKGELSDKKLVYDSTKKEKGTLLTTTKSKESNYQKLLADRLKKKQEVEAELQNLEQQIKIKLDPSLLPKTGTTPLSWPIDKVIITQYFGNTAFAATHTAIYNGAGHNGIDMGTPTGTAIKAPAAGKVIGAGNTDVTCVGASYGKWILLQHPNGLSTLYAHLSLIKVLEGSTVGAGEIIGYTGNTGYSTGPHLHFTVYASQGVSVGSLKSKVAGCGTYRLPISALNSYLNPMTYLPPL